VLRAADLVTLARTGVEYDYRGDVIDAHAPEMPTRFAKQLTQVIRGAVAIGMDRDRALALAIRCARDSMPPLRLAIVDHLAKHPDDTTADVRKALGKPRATVDRQLQALHMLGLLDVAEEETQWAGQPATRWHYSLAAGIDPASLTVKSVPDLSPPAHKNTEKRASLLSPDTDISGTDLVLSARAPW
jgi:DNA-binding transcriptional ArsR family regulator